VSETVGLLAAICVLATFCMQSLTRLRALAIVSNLLFIVYAASADLLPILLLHTVLLPINGWSLGRLLGGRSVAILSSLSAATVSIALIVAMSRPAKLWNAAVTIVAVAP
jgi:hypothetical protein